jgi:FkbM family methyltransferase
MSELYSVLRRFVPTIKAGAILTSDFGLRGLSLFWRYYSLKYGKARDVEALLLPRARFPIHLRRRTRDRDVFSDVFLTREYDFSDFVQAAHVEAAYEDAVAKGEAPLILDCGAHIGLASVWLALKYPRARIYALEPDEGNFAMLVANTTGYPAIVPLRGAIWDRNAPLVIANKHASDCAFRVEEREGNSEHSLRAYTVREIMNMAGANTVLLAKIDIEGGEQALFRTDTHWLGATQAIAIELHDWLFPGGATSRNFLVALASYPFEVMWRDQTMFCVRTPPRVGSAR